MKKKGKYRFQDGGSTDFFNQIAQAYAQQFNDGQDGGNYGELEQVDSESSDDGYNQDYEDLLQNYQDLQDQYDQLSSSQSSNLPNTDQYDNSFLDFLFSDTNSSSSNLPVNPDALKPKTRVPMGVNPFVESTQKDIFNLYPGTYSKGIWGDKAHQQRKSDHNTGDAEDFGFKDGIQAQDIVSKLQSEAGQRKVKYIIYNSKIWNPSISNEWRPYNGTDPHTDHIHVSYKRQNGGSFQTGGGVRRELVKDIQPKQLNPIFTDNPNDPRLKAYNDSLNLYKSEAEFLKQIDKGKFSGKEFFNAEDNNGQTPNNQAIKTYLSKNTYSLGNGTNGNGNPVSGYYINSFKKPVQPVIYKKPEPTRQKVRSIGTVPQPSEPTNNIPFKGNPISNPAGQPTKYAYQYQDPTTGQQKVIYFPDIVKWSQFTNSQPWQSKSSGGNGAWAGASGGIRMQTGGVASNSYQQYVGLNDPRFNQMFFPVQGINTFRGLDNGQPVLIQDERGKKKILKGKYDTSQFYGNVFEHRM